MTNKVINIRQQMIVAVFALSLAAPSTIHASDSSTTGPDVQPDGAALYTEHCARCHRPLAKTSKPGRSAARLRSSIEHFPAMRSLMKLTDAELNAIVEATRTR